MYRSDGYDGIYTTSVVSHYLMTHLYQLAKTHFNPVVSPLTVDYAAKKIMHAILVCIQISSPIHQESLFLFQTNRKFVCVPRFLYLVPFVKGLLPSRAFLILLNTLINPKIPLYVHTDSYEQASNRDCNSPPPAMNGTHHHRIHRRRSHASSCD